MCNRRPRCRRRRDRGPRPRAGEARRPRTDRRPRRPRRPRGQVHCGSSGRPSWRVLPRKCSPTRQRRDSSRPVGRARLARKRPAFDRATFPLVGVQPKLHE
ncbi:MAG: hypothetical protein COZ06_36070 [Armatimonadetes bacterium CG_4_10_14_3_um_filter_66_18]|nr:MAG: hypothetical protein COZ06_36070 [Armatimonadetes bacterium CG_4_10_14_3_um_filter_66_18]